MEPLQLTTKFFVPCETALPLQSDTDGRSLWFLLQAATQNPVDGCQHRHHCRRSTCSATEVTTWWRSKEGHGLCPVPLTEDQM